MAWENLIYTNLWDWVRCIQTFSRSLLLSLQGYSLAHLWKVIVIRHIQMSRGKNKSNIRSIFKKGKKEDLEICRKDSLVVSGKIMKQILLQPVFRRMMGKNMIGIYQEQINCPLWWGKWLIRWENSGYCLLWHESFDVTEFWLFVTNLEMGDLDR